MFNIVASLIDCSFSALHVKVVLCLLNSAASLLTLKADERLRLIPRDAITFFTFDSVTPRLVITILIDNPLVYASAMRSSKELLILASSS